MKRSITFIVLSLGFLVLTAKQGVAQSTNLGGGAQRTQEQSLQDLVNEVRQLRAMLQRLNTTIYKTNVIVERLKFQQELVSRNSRELDEVREKLGEARTRLMGMKEVVQRAETRLEAGMKTPEDVAALKAELEATSQREARLVQRETQLINELSVERLKLSELNDQLTKLDLEMR